MKRKVFEILFYIFFIGAMGLMLFRMYLKNKISEDRADQLGYVVLGLLFFAVIAKYAFKLFPKWFNAGPDQTTNS